MIQIPKLNSLKTQSLVITIYETRMAHGQFQIHSNFLIFFLKEKIIKAVEILSLRLLNWVMSSLFLSFSLFFCIS